MILNNAAKFLLDVIFPSNCVSCGKRTDPATRKNGKKILCDDCFYSITINNGFFCPECGRRLPRPKVTCHPAAKFVLTAATSFRNKAVSDAIHALKYKKIKGVMGAVADIIGAYLDKINKNNEFGGYVIVPIPIHPKKERQRGFNQADLISLELKKVLGLRVEPILVKIKNNPSQTELKNYKEREINIQNSFGIKDGEAARGKNIILVDDVFTSGATLKEATRILKSAGAKKIIAFVVAKA
jgi:ComF family protein